MIAYSRFRFCPRCGGGRIKKFQDMGMQCPACGYLYFHNAASAVSAVIETPRGIVMVRRAQAPRRGYLDLPGGFVGYGETLEGALKREVREELGLAIKDLRYFGSFPNRYDYGRVTYFTTDAFFTCKAVSLRSLSPREEVSDIAILRAGEVDPQKLAFSSARKAIQTYQSVRKQPPRFTPKDGKRLSPSSFGGPAGFQQQ